MHIDDRRASLLRRVEASGGGHGGPAPSEQELQILKSALHCFAARGFAATSVRMIATEAGVTGPMINYYFTSKEQLYRRLIDIVSDAMQERIGHAAAIFGPLRERLRRVMHAYVDFAIESPDAVSVFFEAAYGPSEGRPDIDIGAIRDVGQVVLTRVIVDAVESADFVLREGYDLRALLDLCIAALMHVIGREVTSGWAKDGGREARMKTELERMVTVILDGIAERGAR